LTYRKRRPAPFAQAFPSVLTIRADPTLSEAFHEASLAALGQPLRQAPSAERRAHEFDAMLSGDARQSILLRL